MAAAESAPPPIDLPPATDPTTNGVTNNAQLHSANITSNGLAPQSNGLAAATTARLPYVYTRRQIIHLCKSPLVVIPVNMPALKDWFGDWHEQQSSNKRDTESSANTNGARERRPRRDAEDGVSFRSGGAQPAQMGSFKHQPLRDREARERERDQRDKDAQDKLRSLSDKYDRDRMSLTGGGSPHRGKERELAPHLQGRNGATANGASGRGERREPREPGKRRAGEPDDWRKGDRGRDDNSGPRDEREDRDRPQSRARDGSRPERESSTKRDRERDDRDGERDRDRDRRRGGDRDKDKDKDRDDRRRDRDEPRRARDPERDRDRDRDDDGRHWRDDGLRDERLAVRRDRERDKNRDRDKDKDWERGGDRDRERWGRGDRTREDEPPNRTRDRDRERPDPEDRDRPKRGGRERRGAPDDPREKEDRKEREKDKTPAWMDTYIPSSESAGILGGQGDNGELDELQAWKKTMKERELAAQTSNVEVPSSKRPPAEKPPQTGTNSLDEIQQFKLIMQAAKADPAQEDAVPAPPPTGSAQQSDKVPSATTTLMGTLSSSSPGIGISSSVTSASNDLRSISSNNNPPSSSLTSQVTSPTSTGSNPLLAMFNAASANSQTPAPHELHSQPDGLSRNPIASRLFPTTPNPEDNAVGSKGLVPPVGAPQGSRLGRGPRSSSQIPSNLQPVTSDGPSSSSSSVGRPGSTTPGSHGVPQLQDQFGRLALDSRERIVGDAARDQFGPPPPHSQGRTADVNVFSPPIEQPGFMHATQYQGSNLQASAMSMPQMDSGVAPGKASRFAKLWDQDTRKMNGGGIPGPVDLNAFNGQPMPRQEQPMHIGGGDARMNDLFLMLNNSQQGQQNHRGTSAHAGSHNPSPTPPSFPMGHGLQTLPQHQLQQLQEQQHRQLQQQQLQQLQLQQQQQRFIAASRQEVPHGPGMGRDERGFAADGVVPGLHNHNVPVPPRRDHYNDQYEDMSSMHRQRLPPGARGLEQLVPPQMQSAASLGQGRGLGPVHMQPNMYGRGPSPHQPGNAQRMPTGLTHLGTRPPHDPGQFIGVPIHQLQPGFNGPGSGTGPSGMHGGHPQLRGGPHQMHGVGPNGPGGPPNIDMRTQAQLLALGAGGGGMGMGGNRGPGGYGMQQPHPAMPYNEVNPGGRPMQPPFQPGGGGMHPSQMHSPPGGHGVSNDAQNLMNLLMSGGRRE